jgi:hypothetical protein
LTAAPFVEPSGAPASDDFLSRSKRCAKAIAAWIGNAVAGVATVVGAVIGTAFKAAACFVSGLLEGFGNLTGPCKSLR